MTNGYIYNAVHGNSTKKEIYRDAMAYVNKIIRERIEKFVQAEEKKMAKQDKQRAKALQIALDWEREKTAKEIRNLLRTLKRKDDRLFATKAHNAALELAIRSIKI